MRRTLLTALLLTIICQMPLLVAAQRRAGPAPRRPNIVLILADDLGYSDLGAYGGEIATPNLDRLARDGMRFTQFYNSGRCCPSRAALLTGLHPQQTGVGWMVDQTVQPAGYTRELNDSCATIAEVLSPAGYRTLMSGKWHVGERKGAHPVDRGFARSFALINALANNFGVYGNYPTNTFVGGQMRRIEDIERAGIWVRDDQPFVPPTDGSFYATDAITDHALAYLEEQKTAAGKPFFLYLAYTAPHWALQAKPADINRYLERYKKGWDATRAARFARLKSLGIVNATWDFVPRDARIPAWDVAGNLQAWQPEMRFYPRTDGTKPWDSADNLERWALKMAVHAAMVDNMDQNIGRVLAKLKELNADENTLVVFLSDNGADAYRVDRGAAGVEAGDKDSFTSFGPAWAQVANTPFRNYKARIYEGGIATPLIVRYPKVVKAGSVTNHIGHVSDLMATALEAAGVKYPNVYRKRRLTPLAGKSLLPILRGGKSAHQKTLYWEHEGNRGVREGDWKLVADFGKPWELYNLAADRTEQHDLAAQRPTKVAALERLYESWARRANVASWQEFVNRRK